MSPIPNDGGVVERRGHHRWRDRWEADATSRKRKRRGKRWDNTASALSFMLRWVFAVAAAMLVAGVIEYGFARQQIVDRGLEDSRRNYEALAAGLEEALAAEADPAAREDAIADEVRHLEHSPGTVYVGLFDASGRMIAQGEGEIHDDDTVEMNAQNFAEVVSTGETKVEHEAGPGNSGVTGYEYLVPVSAPEGTLVLKIDQHPDFITELVRNLGPSKLIGLLTAIVVALPLSYLFGGRSLQRRQLLAEQQADADPLTGLSGRRPFQPSLEATLKDKRYSVVTLALLDVDGFKQLNDRLGHIHGDRVLQALADSFEELGGSDLAFRLGGDEFAVVLPGRNATQATEALERVRAALAVLHPGVTFSAGVATSEEREPLGLTELWERSDAALYEAKRLGRRRSVSFQSMAEGHTISAEKIDELTILVSGYEPLNVAFQPIWDLRRGVVLAMRRCSAFRRGPGSAGRKRRSNSPNASE